jgi:hypothetical protein
MNHQQTNNNIFWCTHSKGRELHPEIAELLLSDRSLWLLELRLVLEARAAQQQNQNMRPKATEFKIALAPVPYGDPYSWTLMKRKTPDQYPFVQQEPMQTNKRD